MKWICEFLIIICVGFLFLSSILVLILMMITLYASPSSPSFSIDLFDNQSLINLTRPNDPPMNFTIHFHLKLKNRNSAIGLHYPDALNFTFSYLTNVSTKVTLAEYKVDSFYQGNGKSKHVKDLVKTNITPKVLDGTDMVSFRVDLVGAYRYKRAGAKRHKVELGCVVAVNYTTSQKLRVGFLGFSKSGLDYDGESPRQIDSVGF